MGPWMLDQKMKDLMQLNLMQLDWNLFMRRIVTGSETSIHHCYPQTKHKNMLWQHASSTSLSKLKMQISAGKTMCTVSWCAKGIVLTDSMHRRVTITGVYSPDLLHKLHVTVNEKHWRIWHSYITVNLTCSQVTCWTSCRTWMQIQLHVPFDYMRRALNSRHLASSVSRQRFSTNDELKYAIKDWFNG